MPAKKFVVPFASTGNKTAVPNALQPDGTVSYAQGFGPDYELNKTVDPVNAKDVPRAQTNQLYYDLTDAVGEQQLYGVALWGADRAPYPLNARAYHTGKLWRSNAANNNGEPGVSVTWDDVSAQSPDYLNTTRIDVASAATVNLTSSAPNTRSVNITGTTAITAFTVAAGQLYFVRFAGALTLTNNAGIATQSGANIKTAAGDTCIIRATAANVVELVSYATAKNQSLGYVQTWQDLTAIRAAGTTYTNTTGKPIAVMVGGNSAGAGGTFNLQTVVEGLTIQAHLSDYQSITSFIVPQGSTYQVTTTGSLSKWSELR